MILAIFFLISLNLFSLISKEENKNKNKNNKSKNKNNIINLKNSKYENRKYIA